MEKIYCENCDSYITKYDSCECGTTMYDIEQIEINNADLADIY